MPDTYKDSKDAHEAFREYINRLNKGWVSPSGIRFTAYHCLVCLTGTNGEDYTQAFNAWLKKQESGK